MFDNPVGLILALIGSAGLGGFFKEIMTGIRALKSGVSVREKNRKRDLVSERDFEYSRAEVHDYNGQLAKEYAAVLRLLLVQSVPGVVIPPWPQFRELPKRPEYKNEDEAKAS